MKICGEAPFSSRDPARPRWLPESASENQEGTASVCEKTAILIMAASMRAGQSWDLRLPYASLRVTLRVGTQKQPTFMHLLTGLRLQHPPRGSNSHFGGSEASKRELPGSESQNENC